MLNNTDLINDVKNGSLALSKEDFTTDFDKRVFEAMTECEGVFEEGALNGIFNEREFSYIMKIKMRRNSLGDNSKDILAQLINNLKEEKELSQEEDPVKHLQKLMELKRKE